VPQTSWLICASYYISCSTHSLDPRRTTSPLRTNPVSVPDRLTWLWDSDFGRIKVLWCLVWIVCWLLHTQFTSPCSNLCVLPLPAQPRPHLPQAVVRSTPRSLPRNAQSVPATAGSCSGIRCTARPQNRVERCSGDKPASSS
jgi:hypothetical protein